MWPISGTTGHLTCHRWLYLSCFFAISSCTSTIDDNATFPLDKTTAPAPHIYAWMQLGPHGVVQARAITRADHCPTAVVDGRAEKMKVRAPADQDFPVLICELSLFEEFKTLVINGHYLPQKVPYPQRIALIGNTGCRISKDASGKMLIQNCHDNDGWPFAHTVNAITQIKPDLIIHLGNYHYREASCPEGERKCAGSVAGDNFASFEQDFLEPAAPLFASAVLVFLRGDHELCTRGGYSWFRLFDPRSFATGCRDETEPYEIPLTDHRLAIIDAASPTNIPLSLSELASKSSSQFTFLFMHQPTTLNHNSSPAALEAPKDRARPLNISAIFTGYLPHAHLATTSTRGVPWVAGRSGGAMLDVLTNEERLDEANAADQKMFPFNGFGFVALTRLTKATWQVTIRDANNADVTQCVLREYHEKQSELVCGQVTRQ